MKPHEIDPFLLPSVDLGNVKALPKKSGVYFAISRSGQILYIGSASSLCDRWKGHHRKLELAANDGIRIGYALITDDILDVERECITYFKPLLNGKKLTIRAPRDPEGRVPLQIMVYPYVKEIIEEIASNTKPRSSVSSIGEMVLTEYAGDYATTKAKAKKARNGK